MDQQDRAPVIEGGAVSNWLIVFKEEKQVYRQVINKILTQRGGVESSNL